MIGVNLSEQDIVHHLENGLLPILKQLLNILQLTQLVRLGKQLHSVDATARVASTLLNKIGDEAELHTGNILLSQDVGEAGDELAV